MLRKLLTVLTVVALLAAPAAADVFANFEDYDLDPIIDLVPGQPVQRWRQIRSDLTSRFFRPQKRRDDTLGQSQSAKHLLR